MDSNLIESTFNCAFIQRWNDYPRFIDINELDKQAHKLAIAYILYKFEGDSSICCKFIDAFIFEFFKRSIVTDIRPDVYREIIKNSPKGFNKEIANKLKKSLSKSHKNRDFISAYREYFGLSEKKQNKCYDKCREILSAASYISTRWEFNIIYHTNNMFDYIKATKVKIEDEAEDYNHLRGFREIFYRSRKIPTFIDIIGRLRFQKRWSGTLMNPRLSVLGHMLIVAIFTYFHFRFEKGKYSDKKIYVNFFSAFFHDIGESLVRDVISPVKDIKNVKESVNSIEVRKIKEEILPLIPSMMKGEFKKIIGFSKYSELNEFKCRRFNKNTLIYGSIIKDYDRLSAFCEASLSPYYELKTSRFIPLKKLRDNIEHKTVRNIAKKFLKKIEDR